jgi:ribosomal protein S18 acetylase RimI-like enzyme
VTVRLEVREPTPADCAELLANLRPADRDELEATIGEDTDKLAALEYCVARSSHAWVLTIDGRVGMLSGLVPVSTLLGGDEAQPWMMGTTLMAQRPGVLTRISARYLRVMKGCYPRLANYVDARNTTSIAWLRRLGFTVHADTVPIGPRGLPFHLFEMIC